MGADAEQIVGDAAVHVTVQVSRGHVGLDHIHIVADRLGASGRALFLETGCVGF